MSHVNDVTDAVFYPFPLILLEAEDERTVMEGTLKEIEKWPRVDRPRRINLPGTTSNERSADDTAAKKRSLLSYHILPVIPWTSA